MEKLLVIGKTGFGVFGAFSAIYWGLFNSKIGVIRLVFGQLASDWVNAKMSLIYSFVPYIVTLVAAGFLMLWFVSWVVGLRAKKKKKSIPRDETIEKIKEMLDNLK